MRSGLQLGTEFSELFPHQSNPNAGWQLPRSAKKNEMLKISGITITGKISNKAIGISLAKDHNVILTIAEIEWLNLRPQLLDTVEILYKHDLFPFSLGYNWIFSSIDGGRLLAHIFLGSPDLISRIEIKTPHLLISYDQPSRLNNILQRFPRAIYWSSEDEIYVNNLVVLSHMQSDEIEIIRRNHIRCVISTVLSSTTIERCQEYGIVPIWVNSHELLNEIARDLTYTYGRLFKMPIEFSPMKIQKMKIDGLDGI